MHNKQKNMCTQNAFEYYIIWRNEWCFDVISLATHINGLIIYYYWKRFFWFFHADIMSRNERRPDMNFFLNSKQILPGDWEVETEDVNSTEKCWQRITISSRTKMFIETSSVIWSSNQWIRTVRTQPVMQIEKGLDSHRKQKKNNKVCVWHRHGNLC